MTDQSSNPPAEEAARGRPAANAAPAQNPALGSEPFSYFANRPIPRRLSVETLCNLGRTILYLFSHTITSYDPALPKLDTITLEAPSGCIQRDQVDLCRLIYDGEEHRREKIEEKSIAALSVAALLTPLIVSAVVYLTSSSRFVASEQKVVLVIYSLSFLSLLVAFIASVRATGIRAQSTLHIHSVIDPNTKAVKEYTPDYFGRGLLFCASTNAAVNDHIADFVRAAQVFLTLAVFFLVIGAVPLAFTSHSKTEAQDISRAIQAESEALTKISESTAKTAEALNQLAADRRGLNKTEEQVSVLQTKVEELARPALTQRNPGRTESGRNRKTRRLNRAPNARASD